ncbi:MAG: restriction endonuclease [Clostridiales bacterium]|nr:restriction endonuclease [Clostridiales bacterium]
MKKAEKKKILKKAKLWMQENIVAPHVINTKKLANLDEIKINPFLWPYLANYYCGDSSYRSLATVAVLPRVLGTSITTTFGTQMQGFISTVLDSSLGSTVPGIDIEFIDAVDGRKKYCQVKSGPQALNNDDIETISNHFKGIKNLAKTNRLPLQANDLALGLLYGEEKELNAFVKKFSNDYEVYIGEEFWHRLTGDKDFYYDLAKAMAEVAETVDSQALVDDTIDKLAKDIEKKQPKP